MGRGSILQMEKVRPRTGKGICSGAHAYGLRGTCWIRTQEWAPERAPIPLPPLLEKGAWGVSKTKGGEGIWVGASELVGARGRATKVSFRFTERAVEVGFPAGEGWNGGPTCYFQPQTRTR